MAPDDGAKTPPAPADSGRVDPDPADSGRVDPAVRRLTFILIVGAFAVIFDTTIMSVAIDSLARQLHV